VGNPITQENIAKLKKRGFIIVDLAYGRLASGGMGKGRLADNEKIIGTIKMVLGRKGDLAGKNIVITAGGTREALTPSALLEIVHLARWVTLWLKLPEIEELKLL